MLDNELHKGEFIVAIEFLCIKSQNSWLKIEGHLILSIRYPISGYCLTKFHEIPYSNMTRLCPQF